MAERAPVFGYDPETGKYDARYDAPASGASEGALAPSSVMRKGMGLIEQREQAGKAEEEALAKKQQAESPYQQKLKAIYDSPVTAHAELQKMKEAPKPEDYKKYTMEFLGAMTLVGAFASRKSRNAGNAAIKAYTGAMNGWHEGNLEAYAQATKQWEENARATIENNRVELQRYTEQLNNREANIEQLKAGLMLAGMESQNDVLVTHLRAGNIDAALKDIDMLTNMQTKLEKSVDTLTGLNGNYKDGLKARINDLNEHPERIAQYPYDDFIKIKNAGEIYNKQDPSFPTVKDPGANAQFGAGSGGGALNLSNPQQAPPGVEQRSWDMAADAFRITGKLPQVGWGSAGSEFKARLEMYAQQREAQGIPIDDAARKMASSQAAYAGEVSGSRALGTRSVNVRLAANLAASAIPQALKDSEEINRAKFTPINAAKLNAARLGSDVALSKWDVSNLQVAELWARALNPQSYTIRQDTFELAINRLSQIKDKAAYRATLQSIFQAIQREEQGISVTQQQQRGENVEVPDPFAATEKPAGSGGDLSSKSNDELKKILGIP